MRVGILTYHYVFNEGAIWQACALCRRLRERLPGHTVEIIDYRHRRVYEALAGGRSDESKAVCEAALLPWLGLGRIVTDREDEAFDAINARGYDAVITGSDIVWKFDAPRGLGSRIAEAVERRGFPSPDTSTPYRFARDVKNWTLETWRQAVGPGPADIPAPNTYWLGSGVRGLRCAYAASIGYSMVDRLPAAAREALCARLMSFDLLSVRDGPTHEFLAQLAPSLADRAVRVPDPAWLWTEALPDGRAVLARHGVTGDAPLAGVLFPRRGQYGRRLQEWVFPLLRRRGYRIVSIIDRNSAADVDLAGAALSPFEWWAVIRELKFLFTVRTHPSIAALMYHTPLFNVDITAMYARAPHSKSADMLGAFGLDSRCLWRRRDMRRATVEAGLDAALDSPLDWNAVDRQIGRHRADSEAFLGRVAEGLHDRVQ